MHYQITEKKQGFTLLNMFQIFESMIGGSKR